MLRRALEQACVEAGATSGSLCIKIAALTKEGILSAIQASTAHAIRAFANKYGAHPDDDLLDDVSDEEMSAVVSLTVAVVEGLARRRAMGPA